MALDTFICGTCQVTFNDINAFVAHKRESCKPLDNLTPEGGTAKTDIETDRENNETESGSVQEGSSMMAVEGSPVMTTEVNDAIAGEQQTVIIIQSTAPSDHASVAQNILDGNFPQAEVINIGQFGNLAQLTINKGPGRKRGRKRKEEKEAKKVQKIEKPSEPEKLPDGKLQCKCCKKTFVKERFYKTHRCMPTTDYVAGEGDIDLDDPHAESDFNPENEDSPDDEDFEIPDENPSTSRGGRGKGKTSKESAVELTTGLEGDETDQKKAKENLSDLPIFKTDEDKLAFEQSLNVDLSSLNIDNMFRQHTIEQDLNEKAPISSRVVTNCLSLYSCNTCEKIFKTLSHMRLHCLIHTNLKPFKCPRCPYASNAKGNLYTHMRKHTGQFYECKYCSFKSVNKSHILEHEAIHSSKKHQCEICRRFYNTMKSLVNHVRKYHSNSSKGEEYLATFLQGGRQRGTTVIHQCHVCNRKFKKKIDRDRHLFVHDIKDLPNVQSCELCDYTATKRNYLEKHFQKHRVIYRCVQCEAKFLSTVRLIDHLTSVHMKDDPSTRWEILFEECISHSLYLPEPDDSLTGVEKQLVNLPAELSTSSVMAAESLQNMDMLSEAQGTVSGEINTSSTSTRGDNSPSKEAKEGDGSSVDTQQVKNIPDTVQKNSAVTEEIEEGNEAEGMEDTDDRDRTKRRSVIDTLGYRPMTLQIFHKMRETFGQEECEYCGKLYFNKADYDIHLRTHTGDKPFPCSVCGHRATSRETLQQHKDSEHGKATFPCKDCEFTASSRTQLWNHSLTHAGLDEAMGIECPQCLAKFDNLKKLNQHISDEHPDVQSEVLKKMHLSPAFAKECEVRHKVHGKMGRRSFKCPYCDKLFFRANSELQKHIWIHEDIKPYKCPLCTHACRSKNNLQAHMLRHTNEKPYTCPECNKAYKSKTALRWHVRSHKSGKIFKCTKCPYEGYQSSHLKRHMETHNVQKRFMCQHCDYAANTLSYIKLHYSRNHKEHSFEQMAIIEASNNRPLSDNQAYKCLSCDYQFGNIIDLKRHLKVKHHLQVKDLHGLESSQNNVITIPNSTVQFVQYSGDTEIPSTLQGPLPQEIGSQEVNPGLETHTTNTADVDEKTASAVNILQQIFHFSTQGNVGQQFTVQSETGEVVSLNPETIIVQQEGEEVMVADDENLAGNQQYVIQYLSAQDDHMDSGDMVEIVHSTVEEGTGQAGEVETMEMDSPVELSDNRHSVTVFDPSSVNVVDDEELGKDTAGSDSVIELANSIGNLETVQSWVK